MAGYSDKAPLPYAEFALCREMCWTFDELERQPTWRVMQAFDFLDAEARARKLKGG